MIKAVLFDMFETLITHYQSPLYFGAHMAADAGIPEHTFQSFWGLTEYDRTIGKLTLENALEGILRKNGCYSEELLNKLVEKRKEAKRQCFIHLHPEIIPVLEELQKHEFNVGLISNCYSEEAEVIKNSDLYPYFDATYLSFEQGVQKPDEEIFFRCMNHFHVSAEECLYIGDGGNFELETACKLGMKAVQATWYLQEGSMQPSKRKAGFIQADTPLDILKHV